MKTRLKQYLLLILILALGAFLRFYNLNWDQGFHLHPDERFLTMVGNAMKLPQSFSEYLNPQTSLINPANINFKFFVYGLFPLILNKFLAVSLENDNYNAFTIQGRFLSGLFDLFIIILIFKSAKLLEEKYNFPHLIKYFAAFFYAIAVLPIQLSHFFAVDTFLNFFMFASFFCALTYSFKQDVKHFFFSAIFFALAVSSKITAVYILPLNLFFIILHPLLHVVEFKKLRTTLDKKHLGKLVINPLVLLIVYLMLGYFTIRLADPYLFENQNVLNPQLGSVFLENLKTLKYYDNKEVWYPPGVQWINKLVFFPLQNTMLFGLGIPYFVVMLFGVIMILKKHRRIPLVLIILWTILFFCYQSLQFVKVLRYFIFLYPFFAIFAGIGFYYLLSIFTVILARPESPSNINVRKNFTYIITATIIGILLIWPLSFFSIYTQKHSRVIASVWIYNNLQTGSFLLNEHWDDPLPLLIKNTNGKTFQGDLLPVFDPDTDEKWQRINNLLQKGDYLILSSNRGWGSIPTVPEKYPLMVKFYNDLFSGKLEYKKIKEFTSYPSLQYLGIPLEIPDQFADESFTVYDHPKVILFKKQ